MFFSRSLYKCLALAMLMIVPASARADLIGYWDFPSSANLGVDESGNGNTLKATSSSAAYSSSGKIGGGLRLRGSGCLVPTSVINKLPVGNSPYTMTAWIRPNTTSSSSAWGIVGWGNYGTTRQANALRINGANGFSHYWWNADLTPTDAQVSAAGVTISGVWTHVAVSFDGATRSFYLNGNLLVSDSPGVNGSVNANFAIGRTYGSEYFNGYLDDVAIWNTALPAAQIAALANQTITPLSGPKITSFASSVSSAFEGGSVPLSWAVDASKDTGALTVTIAQGATTLYTGSAASGSFTATVPALNGVAQTLTYTLTATDAGSNATTSSSVSVSAAPDVPVATPQSGLVVTAPNTLPVSLVATDPAGTALTYAIVNAPTHGTLSAVSGRNVTYTPASGYAGMDSFSFKVNNGKYDSAPALVSLAVTTTNAAPTAITLSNNQINASLSSGAFVGNLASADPNVGETHVYMLVAGTGSTDNARFSINNHQLRTAQAFAGLVGNSYSVRVRSTNAAGLSVEQPLTLTVVAAPAGKVVINEVLYNGQSNAVHDDFVELYNNTGAAVDVSGWQLTTAISYTFPSGTTLAAGGYLVVAEDPALIQSTWGVTAVGPYTGNLSSDGETLILQDASGTKVCEVDYTPRFPYPSGADGNGASMELINPNLDPSLGGSWRSSIYPATESTTDTASPGKQNLQYAANAAPVVRQVTATPAQPAANVPTVISAKITDPDGVQSVLLQYQIVAPGNFIPATLPNAIVNHLIVGADSPIPANPAFEAAGNWLTVPMNDDGVNGDTQGGDDTYTATLPGQPNRTLIRYRIVVTDNLGSSIRTPYVDDESRNFAYFVYNGVPDYQGVPAATLNLLPNYHFLTRAADYAQCIAYDSSNQLTGNTSSWTYENWEAAIVYDGTVYDHVMYRLHGANGRYKFTSKRAFRWFFNKGYEFQARDNDGKAYPEPWRHLVTENLWENNGTLTYSLNEMVNFYLFNKIGIPAPEATMINFRLLDNAAEQPDAYHGDYWGLMMVHEDYEKNFLDAHNLDKGNLYKLTRDDVNGVSQLRYQAADAVTDGSDHDAIYNTSGKPFITGQSTPAYITSHVNMTMYDYYHALAEAIRHYDYWPSGDNNGAYYFDPATYTVDNDYHGQLWIFPSDTDATWGPTWNYGHDVVHNGLFNDSIDPGGDSYTNPTLWPAYFNALREVRDLLWQPDQINPVVDQFAAIISAQQSADDARWKNAPSDVGNYNELSGAGKTSILNLAQDMKNFAFVGGTWPNGNGATGTVPSGGRAVTLDSLQLGINNSEATMPGTPAITYAGTANYPINNLTFTSSAFAGQGGNTFSAMQWRVAEVTDTTAPAYVAGQKALLEWNASYDSGVLTTFTGQYRFPASACKAGHTYRARVRHLDSAGRWSHWSSYVQFTATAADISGYQNSLEVTEFMYYPATPTAAETAAGYGVDDFQYLEVRNVSSVPVDLTDVSFTKGVNFSFPSGMTLAPGASTVAVANAAAFAERYGTGVNVAGSWQGSGQSLAHKGEEVKLSYGSGQAIVDFTYTNMTPWPVITSGSGYSCVLIQPATLPDPTNPANWRKSYSAGGNPGGTDGATYAAWAAAYPGAVNNPSGDGDGDGISNLLEYAFGGNPGVAGTGILPTASMQALSVNGTTGNYLTLTFKRWSDTDDLAYHVESSSNLVTWTENGVLVSSTADGTGMVTQVWRSATPATSGTAAFMRVRVTKP